MLSKEFKATNWLLAAVDAASVFDAADADVDTTAVSDVTGKATKDKGLFSPKKNWKQGGNECWIDFKNKIQSETS